MCNCWQSPPQKTTTKQSRKHGIRPKKKQGRRRGDKMKEQSQKRNKSMKRIEKDPSTCLSIVRRITIAYSSTAQYVTDVSSTWFFPIYSFIRKQWWLVVVYFVSISYRHRIQSDSSVLNGRIVNSFHQF